MQEQIAILETSLAERWESLNVQDGIIDGLQEEIAALRAKVSEQDREYASVVNQFHDSLKRNTALEKVAEAAPELERVKYAWALYCGRGSKWEDAWREAGYLKEDGDVLA